MIVADLFHPVNGLAGELFLDSDVRHCRAWCGAVPVFLTWRSPDHVARLNFLDRIAPALYPSAASRHDQGLAQRVGVPCRTGAGLECDTAPGRACRIVGLDPGSYR